MAWFRGADPNGVTSVDTAVLLVNLGTPDAPESGPIRRYPVSYTHLTLPTTERV